MVSVHLEGVLRHAVRPTRDSRGVARRPVQEAGQQGHGGAARTRIENPATALIENAPADDGREWRWTGEQGLPARRPQIPVALPLPSRPPHERQTWAPTHPFPRLDQ